jgi:hypothetical protein
MKKEAEPHYGKKVVGCRHRNCHLLLFLLCEISGNLLVIEDGAAIHHAQVTKEFLKLNPPMAPVGTLARLCPWT